MKTFPVYAGLSIVGATHVYMLNYDLPEDKHTLHAWLNLGAAGLIYYGVFMQNEHPQYNYTCSVCYDDDVAGFKQSYDSNTH